MMAMRMWDLPRVLGKAPCGISGLGVFIYFLGALRRTFLRNIFQFAPGFPSKNPARNSFTSLKLRNHSPETAKSDAPTLLLSNLQPPGETLPPGADNAETTQT